MLQKFARDEHRLQENSVTLYLNKLNVEIYIVKIKIMLKICLVGLPLHIQRALFFFMNVSKFGC